MRDRLIELIKEGNGGYHFNSLELIADHLLANGVIVLPCKLGEKLYGIFGLGSSYSIYELQDDMMSIFSSHSGNILFSYDENYVDPDCIGKSIFLTREEAEKALAERRKEDAT